MAGGTHMVRRRAPLARDQRGERAFRWGDRAGIACCLLLPVLVKLLAYPAYVGSDDSFIHLAVAKSITGGTDWGINPNQPVNLSSSPVYTLLLTGLRTVGLPRLGEAQAASIICTLFAMAMLALVLQSVTRSPVILLTALAVGASTVHLWRWAGTIMETTLALALLGTTLWVLSKAHAAPDGRGAHYFVLGIVIGLSALTRYELLLLLPCCILEVVLSREPHRVRNSLVIAVGSCVVLAPWLLFAAATFNTLLPTTFLAKTRPIDLVNLVGAKEILSVVISGASIAVICALLALVAHLRCRGLSETWDRAVRPRLSLFLFPPLLLLFFYLKTAGLQSPARYLLPALYVLPITAAAAADGLVANGPQRQRWVVPAAGCLVVVQLALSGLLNQTRVRPVLRAYHANYERAMRSMGSFLNANCLPGDIALVEVDIGTIAYHSNHRCDIADGGALASPELRGLTVTEQIDKVKPTYVVETQGSSTASLATEDPRLSLVCSQRYGSHGVKTAGAVYYANLYVVAGIGPVVAADVNCSK